MANQIIIDIGAAANDGTGDPLRTAFNYVNDNFSNVWNTGLPSSNVLFSGNRILTANTNGNLILAPNGIGKVVANVDIRPNANNTLSLGSSDLRWNSVYTQNLDVGGNVSFVDLTVDGNLTVTGNIIEMGNIVTDAKTIQLANTAANASSANGAGITVGANDNIATLLYNSGSNVWTTNIGMSVTGNVTAPYFIGNGSLLTGISTSSLGNLSVTGSAIQLATGAPNTSVYLTANGVSGNAYVRVPSNPTTLSDGLSIVNLYGRVEIKAKDGAATQSWYFQEDGSLQLPGSVPAHISSDGDIIIQTGSSDHWTFGVDGALTAEGNINPLSNVTYSLGNATNQWKDLWVSNATIYMDSVPISLTAGNILTVNGADVVTTAANGESSIGNLNILGTTIEIAAGAPETLINISPDAEGWAFLQLPNDVTANTANTRVVNAAGNVTIETGDFSTGGSNVSTWAFDNTGNLSVPRDINFNGGSIVQVPDEDFHIRAQDAENDGWGLYLEVDDGANNVESRVRLERDSIQVGVGLTTGPARYWSFDNSGRLNLAGDIWGDYSGNLSILARGVTDSSLVEIATQDSSDIKRSNVTVTRDAVTVTTSSGAYTWTFDVNGDLIVPGSNAEIYVGNAVGNVAGNSISIVGGDADQTAYYATPGGNVNITGGLGAFNDGGGGGQGGSVNISSGLSADPAGVPGNVNIDTGDYTWTYGYNGELWVPGGTGYISSAANTISIYSNEAETNGMLFYNGGVDIYAVDQVAIFANNAGSSKETRFLADGTISVQGMIYPTNGLTDIDIGNSTNSFRDGYFSGNVTANIVAATSNGSGTNFKVGDDMWLGDVNVSDTMSLRGQQNAANAYLLFGNADTTSTLGRSGSGPLTWTGNFSVTGNISGNTAGYAIGYRDIPQISFTGNATIATTDAGKHYYSTQSSDYILTIANNASQGFQVGAVITVVNQGTGNITVAQGSGVSLYMAGSSGIGNRAVGAYGLASVMKVATDTWVISGTGVY